MPSTTTMPSPKAVPYKKIRQLLGEADTWQRQPNGTLRATLCIEKGPADGQLLATNVKQMLPFAEVRAYTKQGGAIKLIVTVKSRPDG